MGTSIDIISQGGTEKLAQLKRRIANVASSAARQRLLNVVAHEALSQALLGFERSKDPYGKAWKPLKLRDGQPLLDTGRLRNSLHAYADAGRAGVATDVKYAALHQHGGTIRAKKARALRFRGPRGFIFVKQVTVPARPFLPDSRGVPRAWDRAIRQVATDFFQAAFGFNARARTTRKAAV